MRAPPATTSLRASVALATATATATATTASASTSRSPPSTAARRVRSHHGPALASSSPSPAPTSVYTSTLRPSSTTRKRNTSSAAGRLHIRAFHDYIRTVSPSGASGRISLKPSRNGIYGLATSRGTRAYQEDTTSVSCVSLPPSVLKASYLASSSATVRDAASEWTPSPGAEQEVAGQVVWFGCFDGHGGQPVSQFLCKELHAIFENVNEDMVTDTVQYTRSLGGYFRRFNGGLLERWARKEELQAVRAGAAGGPQHQQRLAAAAKAASEARAKDQEREKRQQREREEEEQKTKPKTFADLVSSAKGASKGSASGLGARTAEVGGGSGTVSAVEASSFATTSTQPTATKGQEEGVDASVSSQPSLIHSADSRGEVPAAGPVEGAQQAEPIAATNDDAASSSSPTNSTTQDDSVSADGGPGHLSLTRRIPPPSALQDSTLTVSERLTLAWLHTDRVIQSTPSLDVGGSTASVILLHSLDLPTQPFYSSSSLHLTTAHIGDTRVLLASVATGLAIPLTNYHHPDDRSESERLRKMGAGMITDSFGEARWMGALANTRSFGDGKFKKVGVTSEPELISQLIKGDEYAFVVGFSDGIGGVMSDQEIVDLCRGAKHPDEAARKVLRFAEELGAQDNGTVLVVPLKGWGNLGGQDTTKQRREFRRSKVDLYRDSRT